MEEKYEFIESIDYGTETYVYKVKDYETAKVLITFMSIKSNCCLTFSNFNLLLSLNRFIA